MKYFKVGILLTICSCMLACRKVKSQSWQHSRETMSKQYIDKLEGEIENQSFKKVTSVVVIKNGKILVEKYYNGANKETLHNTRSVGKTFTSTVTGIAIEEGYIKGDSETLNRFYDLKSYENYSPKKDSVTIKSLLSMSSGFDADDFNMDSKGNEEYMYPTDNWVKFALDLPMDKNKIIGKNWNYFTAGIVTLGDILNNTVPEGLEKYIDKKLFQPLGITNYKWQYTPQGVPNTAGGLQMSSLNYAKFGQLYKNGGEWEGQQVLPKSWVEKSFTNHFKNDTTQTAYGYLFWNQEYSYKGKRYNAFQCSGNGGNKIIIFKDEPLVIVITATLYGQYAAHEQAEKIVEEYLLPAVFD